MVAELQTEEDKDLSFQNSGSKCLLKQRALHPVMEPRQLVSAYDRHSTAAAATPFSKPDD